MAVAEARRTLEDDLRLTESSLAQAHAVLDTVCDVSGPAKECPRAEMAGCRDIATRLGENMERLNVRLNELAAQLGRL